MNSNEVEQPLLPTQDQHDNIDSETVAVADGTNTPTKQPQGDQQTTSRNSKVTCVQVWNPSSDTRPPPKPEFSDEYFVPTASEAQKAFAGQVSSRERLTDAPLLTKTLREREQDQKRNEKLTRFPLTRIRIRFSDRTMLEGTLSSSCTISDVYRFVSDSLTQETRLYKFILYQTPPRREFLETDPKIGKSSLIDLQLAPSSLLYIKFSEDSLNQTNRKPSLLPDLLKQAKELPTPPSFDDSSSTSNSSSTSSAFGKKAGELLKTGAKVPKWLQNMS
ncbi:hypothetical protein BY996DRAFT_4605511 [Phakopsora pachyrhizi]|nr:hypothetical protein BY996DRAFT_4605511 [Phakopsora pachyrhizi]